MMKRLLTLVAVAFVAFTLVGCNKKEEQEITIWAWNQNVGILEDAVKRYQEVDPDFKAKVVNFSKKDIDIKINAAATTQDTSMIADIVLGDFIYMRAYYDG